MPGTLGEQSAVRVREQDGVRLTYVVDGAMGLIPQYFPTARYLVADSGVHALVTPGHSPGHTSYVITAGDTRVIAFGDGFHIPAQITNPGWPSRPDVDGEAVLAARATLLTELAKPDTLAVAGTSGGCSSSWCRVGTTPVAAW